MLDDIERLPGKVTEKNVKKVPKAKLGWISLTVYFSPKEGETQVSTFAISGDSAISVGNKFSRKYKGKKKDVSLNDMWTRGDIQNVEYSTWIATGDYPDTKSIIEDNTDGEEE